MPVVNVNATHVYFAEVGKQGVPMVFVHGAAGSHLHWGLQLRALGEIARVVAVDLPGHGRSSPPGRNTVEAYRDVVLGVLDTLAFDRAVIVGHSMGGAIAQSLALTYPDRIAGIGLIGTGARLRVLPVILEGVLLPEGFDQVADFVVENSYAPGLPDELRQRALAEFRACPAQVIHGDFAACNQFDALARVAEIRAPAIVICGKQDRMTPVKYSEYLAAKIPKAQLVLIEGAGHSVMIEQAEQVNRSLSDFLSAQVNK